MIPPVVADPRAAEMEVESRMAFGRQQRARPKLRRFKDMASGLLIATAAKLPSCSA
jgi:hypothetical protein